MLVMVHVRCVEHAHACALRVLCVCVLCGRRVCVSVRCVCVCMFLSVCTGKRLGPLLHPTPSSRTCCRRL